LREKCHKLAALDATHGRARPELRGDIRSFPYQGYLIFFRYRDERFEVVNILEGHRDIESFFEERDET
jgi:plasmid stabilization system protein ParE